MTHEEAIQGYGQWTKRFLNACYQRGKRSNQEWHYVQVTEKQRRGHPHSHILTTFCPMDLRDGYLEKWKPDANNNNRMETVEVLRSEWLSQQVVRSGLGPQYDISFVEDHEKASRYVAKYLFKQTMFDTDWPKNWRRIRYSGDFPKLPEKKTDAFVLLTKDDWQVLARKAVVVNVTDTTILPDVAYHLKGHDVILRLKDKPSIN